MSESHGVAFQDGLVGGLGKIGEQHRGAADGQHSGSSGGGGERIGDAQGIRAGIAGQHLGNGKSGIGCVGDGTAIFEPLVAEPLPLPDIWA